MTTPSFLKMMTVTASTKRAAVSGGKKGEPITNLPSILCAPLDPVNPEIAKRDGLDTPHELRQTFTEASDIVEGDVLVVGSKEYPIKSAAEWEWRGAVYLHLIVEDLKR